MKISIIFAADRKGAIGLKGSLPWHLPADLKYFKETTTGNAMVMGRKTWESFKGRALPNRLSLVMSRSKLELPEGVLQVASLSDAAELAAANGYDHLFVIGGATLFKDALSMADRLYLTKVDAEVDADTYLDLSLVKDWKPVSSKCQKADEKNAFDMEFTILERPYNAIISRAQSGLQVTP